MKVHKWICMINVWIRKELLLTPWWHEKIYLPNHNVLYRCKCGHKEYMFNGFD